MIGAGQPGPAADELTDAQVSAIAAACDTAAGELAEIDARDASVRAVRETLAERQAATDRVREAFTRSGVTGARADRAMTVWLIERLDPRRCVAEADRDQDAQM